MTTPPRPANLFIIPLQDAWRNGLQLGRVGWTLHVTLERVPGGSAVTGGATRVKFSVLDEKNVEVARTGSFDIEDYYTNISMWGPGSTVRFVGFAPLERGIEPTIIVPIAANGAAFDYGEVGRTFSQGPDGEIMEAAPTININGGMPRPISSIGPGRRLIAREPYTTKLTNFLITFRQWYQRGGALKERLALETRRLGRAEVLVELRPDSGLVRGNTLDFFGPQDRPILVEWFPDSGTDTVRVTLPGAGPVREDARPDSRHELFQVGGREDHVELFQVSAILASTGSRYVDDNGTYVTRNNPDRRTAHLHREVKLDILKAWNARRRGASGTFPLRVTLERTSDIVGAPPYTAYATVTVERRFAGKYKGIPLLSVTVNPADYRTSAAWTPDLFPTRNVRTRNQPYTYGPYTLQQVMRGTSGRNPGRWEMTYKKGGRMGGYLAYTGWMVSVADMQTILVALDQRAEQGLSG